VAPPESCQTQPRGTEHWLDRLALFVLLALIPLRTVASETHSFELLRWLRQIDAPASPTPSTTFAFSAVILAVAVLLASVRLWRRPSTFHSTGAGLGAVLLVVAAVISTLRAGQKHLALVGVVDFLALLAYFFVLRQLLTRPWHIRLALGVVLGSGAIVVTKCAYQRLVELPATIEYYEQHKLELTSRPAGDGDSGRAGLLHDYEQRLRAQTVSGYMQHPNVLGSYLILIVSAALSVAADRWRRRSTWTIVPPLLLALAALATLAWVQSKGAIAACGAALTCWGLIRWRMARRSGGVGEWRRAFVHRRLVLSWLLAVAFAVGLVLLLRAKPDALGRSMLFRSLYWQAAWRMFLDQGPWGIGPDNFGRFFTRYKPAECPEDVDDPHCWVIKAAVEWGVIGLAGLVLVFMGYSWRLLRGPRREQKTPVHSTDTSHPVSRGPPSSSDPHPLDVADGSIILWTGAIGAVIALWWFWLLSSVNPGYLAMVEIISLFPWVIGFLLLTVERTSSTRLLNDPPSPVLLCLAAGLIGFLLHAGIDLSLFRAGAATTFFALLAIALAVRDFACARPLAHKAEGDGKGSRRPQILASIIGLAGAACIVLMVLWLVLPAARLGRELQVARRAPASPSWDAYIDSAGYQAYRAAVSAYHFDATAVAELIEELTKRISTPSQVDAVWTLAEQLRRRDPHDPVYWHYLATLHSYRFRFTRNPADLQASIDAMRTAVAAYPTSPGKHLILADLLEEWARLTASAEARRAAVSELQTALDLDAASIYVSEPHRLTEEQRARITARINALRAEDSPIAGSPRFPLAFSELHPDYSLRLRRGRGDPADIAFRSRICPV
jgi:hypothetical protein